jgi:polar amino acid transport system substrate-binding protein
MTWTDDFMMLGRYFLLLFVLVGSFFAPIGFAQTINIVSSQWSPYVDDSMQDRGLAAELVTTALKRKGYKSTLSLDSWQRALEGVRLGVFDANCAIWKTEDRERDLLYSEPYLENKISFIKRKSLQLNYQQLDDLKGYMIGVVRDYAYGEQFTQSRDLIKVPANHIVQNLQKLEAGSIELTLGDERAINYKLQQFFPTESTSFEFVEPPLTYKNLYFAVSRSNKAAAQIIRDFNQSIEEMKQDGSYYQIIDKYNLDTTR